MDIIESLQKEIDEVGIMCHFAVCEPEPFHIYEHEALSVPAFVNMVCRHYNLKIYDGVTITFLGKKGEVISNLYPTEIQFTSVVGSWEPVMFIKGKDRLCEDREGIGVFSLKDIISADYNPEKKEFIFTLNR